MVDVGAAEGSVVADAVDAHLGTCDQLVDHLQGDTGFAFVAFAGRDGHSVENDAQVSDVVGPRAHEGEFGAVSEFL
ncbi:Uncharacterised protein [Mycobacteroides abscessus subsp. abscessus]|nr:Uncharacterised protein [Mycobacteroides abscessus subsp. abscessus]